MMNTRPLKATVKIIDDFVRCNLDRITGRDLLVLGETITHVSSVVVMIEEGHFNYDTKNSEAQEAPEVEDEEEQILQAGEKITRYWSSDDLNNVDEVSTQPE